MPSLSKISSARIRWAALLLAILPAAGCASCSDILHTPTSKLRPSEWGKVTSESEKADELCKQLEQAIGPHLVELIAPVNVFEEEVNRERSSSRREISWGAIYAKKVPAPYTTGKLLFVQGNYSPDGYTPEKLARVNCDSYASRPGIIARTPEEVGTIIFKVSSGAMWVIDRQRSQVVGYEYEGIRGYAKTLADADSIAVAYAVTLPRR